MRVTDERGFTMIELLVSLTLGLVIIFAAATALETYVRTTGAVERRTDNAQLARSAMDTVMRSLRSQACPATGASSVLAGDQGSITYVSDLGDGSAAPEKRLLRLDPATAVLTEQRAAGTRDATTGTVTFGALGGASTLLTRVRAETTLAGAVTPAFQFYAYGTQAPPRPDILLPVPLSSADLLRVARVRVVVRRGPAAGQPNYDQGITLDDEVTLRSVDPSDPSPLPQCP